MEYKRLEIYLGWTCNHKCIFCVEMPTMVKMWNKKITNLEILKKLIKYKKQWYNHVTYLWWEPFIQANFEFALKMWKKLWYTIMVTTNSNTIQIDKIAKKYLPLIDQLVISIPIIDKKVQPIINDTKVIIDFDNVFINIKKYWKWNFLKVNTVLNPLNINHLESIVDFLHKYEVKELSFTYPDIYSSFYSKDYITNKIALPYNLVVEKIKIPVEKALSYNIRLKITDIPFCFLPDKSWIKYTDDFDYQWRTKVMYNEKEYKRDSSSDRIKDINDLINKTKKAETLNSRMRKYTNECSKCKYLWLCWWIAECYDEIYPWVKLNPYTNEI